MRHVLEFAGGLLAGYVFGWWQHRRTMRHVDRIGRALTRALLAWQVRDRLK